MDYFGRRQRAIEPLRAEEGLWIEDPIDLLYLTGLVLSTGKLILQKEELPILFVDGRYAESACSLEGVKTYIWDGLSTCPAPLPKKLFFDSMKLSFQGYESIHKLGVPCEPLEGPILAVRQTKESSEISCLREAALLCLRGYEFLLSILQEGISERECARQLEIFWLSQGGDGLSFSPIIAFGENSSKPHHRAGPRCLQLGDVVLLDIGTSKNHYHSDMTQTLFFGAPPPPMRDVYTIVQKAQKAALSLCKPGASIAQIEATARNVIEDAGYTFVHGLGHGVGLEIHEWPRLRKGGDPRTKNLEVGMVVTIEPGIYLPGVGGVRLETTIVIDTEGYVPLEPIASPTPLEKNR